MNSYQLTMYSVFFTADTVQQYKVEFVVTTTSAIPELNAQFVASMILSKNQKPFNGMCSIDKSSGLAALDNFNITCVNWQDTDGFVAKYEFISICWQVFLS